MYYIFWFITTMAASLLAVVIGLWIDRKLDEKKDD